MARHQNRASKPTLDIKADVDRYLEVLKISVEQHKFHEWLKQERIKRFTAVQIALSGAFGICVRKIPEGKPEELFIYFCFSAGLCLAGMAYAFVMIGLDKRAAAFVKTTKNQVRYIENIVLPMLPELNFMPYDGQFRVLDKSGDLFMDPIEFYKNRGGIGTEQTSAAYQPPMIYNAKYELYIIYGLLFGWVIALLIVVLITPFDAAIGFIMMPPMRKP